MAFQLRFLTRLRKVFRILVANASKENERIVDFALIFEEENEEDSCGRLLFFRKDLKLCRDMARILTNEQFEVAILLIEHQSTCQAALLPSISRLDR